MLLIDMNLRIGKVKNCNDKILVSSSSFKIRTNLKINLDGEKNKPDVKPKKDPDIKSIKEQKQDIKIIRTKPKAYSFIQIMILILKSRFRDIGLICVDIKMVNQKMVYLFY